jgi:hypothetical protein
VGDWGSSGAVVDNFYLERGMTDRELLALAAKAAGIKIDKSEFNGGGRGNTGFNMLGDAVLDWHNYKTWNPLTNDGDALRLAVKLKLNLECLGEAAQVNFMDNMHNSRHINVGAKEGRGHDMYSATRAAIVRAAAEIGKGLG